MSRIPFKMIVGTLPEESARERDDGMRYLAMIVVESEIGEMVCDIDGAPTIDGAKAKGEGLIANFHPGHPAYEEAVIYLEENGRPEDE